MIFLQAAARPTGPAAALLELAEIGALELLVSDACIEELREVLTRPILQRKFPSLTISAVRDFLDRIQACSMYSVNIANVFVLDRDPKDSKYIDLALATKADFFATKVMDLCDRKLPATRFFCKVDTLGGVDENCVPKRLCFWQKALNRGTHPQASPGAFHPLKIWIFSILSPIEISAKMAYGSGMKNQASHSEMLSHSLLARVCICYRLRYKLREPEIGLPG